jgi:beta-galactosidase
MRPRYCCPVLPPVALVCLVLLAGSTSYEPSKNAALVARPVSFNPNGMSTILYGAAFYPEYMPYERLETDVDLMQKAGLTVVRVGESTWSSWEPREGEFQFAWMERVLDRLHKAGIKVILGMPTYSIPTWLYKAHPDILVTHYGTSPPLNDPYSPTYPSSARPGYYGPRQNYDFLNPHFRRHAERVIRQIASHFRDHAAVIGYQIDNETAPNRVPTQYTTAAFTDRLIQRYQRPETINRIWGLAYWGQLVDKWEDLPPPDGMLNPGYRLEWENFHHDIVTDYLAWQAAIVNEYRRPDQFITTCFSSGVHSDLNQWAIARYLDVVAVNPYVETQDRLNARGIWLTGDLARSIKQSNYFVTETNAQTIGWDSRTQYPPYPGQLRLIAYAHVAAGANMVGYWHWSSLHYGQETYWKGVLSHDLEVNRTYAEVSRVASELGRIGPQLVNFANQSDVAILFSADSANAIGYMPFSDRVSYATVLRQMYDALYALNVAPDLVHAESANLSRYKVVLVPPLYSASDEILLRLADYVMRGGHVVMAFKSGFANEYSAVRHVMAPGPLRAAAGFHYQEFSSLAEPQRLTPDPYRVGDDNRGSVWQEFLVPETAEVVASFVHPYWRFPAITRNKYGAGTLTYQATVVTDALQREIVREVLNRAGLTGTDQNLPEAVRVRHGRNSLGQTLHYYFNFSDRAQSVEYSAGDGIELLTNRPVSRGHTLTLQAWDLAIVVER